MAEQATKKDFKELSVSIGKAMDKRLDGFGRSFDKRLSSFEKRNDGRFQKIDTRFEKIDARFEKIDTRFEKIDTQFQTFEHSIIQTVGKQLQDFEQRNDARFQKIEGQLWEVRNEMSELRAQIQQLTVTLDHFLKRFIDFDDEFTILKAEVDLIKDILKEKLGVEVALQK